MLPQWLLLAQGSVRAGGSLSMAPRMRTDVDARTALDHVRIPLHRDDVNLMMYESYFLRLRAFREIASEANMTSRVWTRGNHDAEPATLRVSAEDCEFFSFMNGNQPPGMVFEWEQSGAA